jgi:hypothetical protein
MNMKRLSVLFVAAGLVVTVVSSGALAESGPQATAAGQKTYAKFTSKKLYKPGTFFFGAHEVIEKVSWSKWGKKLAEGTGTYQVNDCIPYCAAGTIHPTPSSIFLTGRERCGRIFVFSRMKVYFAGHKRTSRPFCKN